MGISQISGNVTTKVMLTDIDQAKAKNAGLSVVASYRTIAMLIAVKSDDMMILADQLKTLGYELHYTFYTWNKGADHLEVHFEIRPILKVVTNDA